MKLQKEIDTNLLMDLTDNIPHTLTQHGVVSLKSLESEFEISHTHFEIGAKPTTWKVGFAKCKVRSC